jgi:hypothetical protein
MRTGCTRRVVWQPGSAFNSRSSNLSSR